MTQFLQQLTNGIVLGATYGLIALGYTMVYGIIQLINFAHGEIFMVGAFGGLTLYKYVLPDSWTTNTWLALPLVLLAAIVVAVVAAVLMERFAYRPLRNAPRLAPLITAIGVSIALQEAVRLYYPHATARVPFPEFLKGRAIRFANVDIARTSVFVVVVAVLMMIGLRMFVERSKTGRAMRATSQDPDTAKLMGIDTDKVIVITFVIGAALAGVAGVLQGMRFTVIDFRMGFLGGLKAFTAAVLGGIGNITGAVMGGFLIGLVETMSTQYLPSGSALKDVYVFAVLILVLVFRPAGLFGEQVRTRA